jgi:hypothetical protein
LIVTVRSGHEQLPIIWASFGAATLGAILIRRATLCCCGDVLETLSVTRWVGYGGMERMELS